MNTRDMPADISRYTDSCEYPSRLIEKFCYYWCRFSMICQIRKTIRESEISAARQYQNNRYENSIKNIAKTAVFGYNYE